MTAGLLVTMALVGLVAGVLNYAAAGGSLVPFLVLSMLGMPPLVANATTLAATPLSFVRVFWEIKNVPRVMLIPLVFSAAATAIGVWIVAAVVPGEVFRQAVPVLLIVSVVFLLRFRHIKARIEAANLRNPLMLSHRATTMLTIGFTLTSAYAGAFGGGVAVAILAIGSSVTPWPWPTLKHCEKRSLPDHECRRVHRVRLDRPGCLAPVRGRGSVHGCGKRDRQVGHQTGTRQHPATDRSVRDDSFSGLPMGVPLTGYRADDCFHRPYTPFRHSRKVVSHTNLPPGLITELRRFRVNRPELLEGDLSGFDLWRLRWGSCSTFYAWRPSADSAGVDGDICLKLHTRGGKYATREQSALQIMKGQG